ncbi:MAG: AmmeMemoRadiSam system protein A [Nanoarchaeota archaeon]
MNDKEKRDLLALVRKAIESAVINGEETYDETRFLQKQPVFVTLYKAGHPRGSMGTMDTRLPLGVSVCLAARYAALKDKKHNPLTNKELKKIKIEISLLSHPEEVRHDQYKEKIKYGEHGLIAEIPPFKGTILPQLFLPGSKVEDMLTQVCKKAGLVEDSWTKQECKIHRFTAERFKE